MSTDHAERVARGERLVHGYLDMEELLIAETLMKAVGATSLMGLIRKLLRWAAYGLRATRALGQRVDHALGQLVLNIDEPTRSSTPATSPATSRTSTEPRSTTHPEEWVLALERAREYGSNLARDEWRAQLEHELPDPPPQFRIEQLRAVVLWERSNEDEDGELWSKFSAAYWLESEALAKKHPPETTSTRSSPKMSQVRVKKKVPTKKKAGAK